MLDDLDDPPKKRLFRLHAVGGLCNRLRAILSYRAVHGPIRVVWELDEYVSYQSFEDVFLPLAGVHFSGCGPWDAEDFAPHPKAPPGWECGYLELVPVPPVLASIEEYPRGGHDAIHVRRTDHVPNVAFRVSPQDSEFIAWCIERSPRLPVWIATDNGVTFRHIAAQILVSFGHCLEGDELQALEDHRRNGSLAGAVRDLFMCVRAREFLGTEGSSFTDTIQILRQLSRTVHVRPDT